MAPMPMHREEEYGSALQAASSGGCEQIVRLLLDNGADANAQGGYYGDAIGAAWINGHNRIVQLLLESGVEVNMQGGILFWLAFWISRSFTF
ncbi:hypothetical protein M408DRAFT_159771 [Serendipita vermifera MAFF 305830]|uniref:Uncharacterized protein n=1 Tax=Serendipita vermifera MAFF 305830 TaxID=933852 RepID=A0A0C2WNL7_SERVB|nr:hypothetical protein M408DRAFT_159771 [Serendipita vermifera MAFF 305830]